MKYSELDAARLTHTHTHTHTYIELISSFETIPIFFIILTYIILRLHNS